MALRLPDSRRDGGFILHKGVLPAPPVALSTDRILFRIAYHDYDGSYRADALWMYLTQRKCRELGLFLLAAGFHGPDEDTVLTITNPGSGIRRIIVRASELRLDDPPHGLSMMPFALRYYPSETTKHPWLYHFNIWDLPVFALSNEDDCVGQSEWERASRDTIWLDIFAGTFRFAELLLNAGCSWNEVDEYALEGDAGYRGVGPRSAELKIYLPGSDGWIFPDDDVPNQLTE